MTKQNLPDDRENVIKPAEFKPLDSSAISARPWIKPVSLLLLGCFLLLLVAIWYVFTARSVYFSVDPLAEELEVTGGLGLKVGDRYLLRPGMYKILARRSGYRTLERQIVISSEQNQQFDFQLQKKPGHLFVETKPEGVNVMLDGQPIGVTPIDNVLVEAGSHQLVLQADRYVSQSFDIEVAGKEQAHRIAVNLTPAWSDIELRSVPDGAEILVDNHTVGTTPASIPVLQGERLITLTLDGYKDWQTRLSVAADQPLTLPEVYLEPLDGQLSIESRPQKANVTINEQFRGQTPLTLDLKPKQSYEINLFKPGYQTARRSLMIGSGEQQSLVIRLKPVVAEIRVTAQPTDAKVYVEGKYVGQANQLFSLPTQKQKLEVRKEGYVTYQTYVTPRQGLEQQVKVSLKTLEQAKWEAIKPVVTTGDGQRLKLFRPGKLTMGASRREAGRRANETLRQVRLTKAFYLGTQEVSNQNYRRYEKLHSSGNVEGHSLDGDTQPVVKVSWEQAALYCNWLSQQEGLPEAYIVKEGKVVGFDKNSLGYRLPTEAEWAWAARYSKKGLFKYPWGEQLPPSAKSGNYADRSAAFIIGRVVTQYDDNYAVTAPVGSFLPNQHGLYDMGGNVSEWVHDYYSTQASISRKLVDDPLGPESGKYHVIRGSSWAHGSITELRLSYRDYGIEGRNDVGFRLARYVE